MKPVYLCQTNFSHVWGEMPLLGKCLECEGKLILYIPQSSHNVLLEAAKRILKTEDFDIETQHPDCECSFCCLFKAIAKEELTAGDPTEYVAGTTKGDERD